jgi:hypothetical protein
VAIYCDIDLGNEENMFRLNITTDYFINLAAFDSIEYNININININMLNCPRRWLISPF